MSRVEIDAAAVEEAGREAARVPVLIVAERVRAGTEAGRAMRNVNKYGAITVVETDDGAVVSADGPFAHLDEWGSVNNPPTAAMRRAAASAGSRFEES